MTTPNMQQQLAESLKAQGEFQHAVGSLTQIINSVEENLGLLKTAMVSASSTVYQRGLSQWVTDAGVLTGNLQTITNQLEAQVKAMQLNESYQVELANQVGLADALPMPAH